MKVGIIQYMDSGHLLPGHPKCGVPHGHTYKVELTVEGPLQNGMVMDFSDVKGHLKTVMGELDHRDLNTILEFPSCENLCAHIHGRMQARLPGKTLHIRVWEGDGKWAEM
ncbi:MAG: 6-carboxytetrahydropterin synthase [Planctomycetes bacterium]|nr:6-carboxytetrahydropterin synthase [Planctomycetota bacterium]